MITTFPKESANKPAGDVLVVGVGNRLLSDEGVGLHIIDNLPHTLIPSYVSIIDCGCDLLSLMPHLDRARKVIIIDAIRAGGKAGEVYKFDYSQLETAGAQMRSAHQINALDALHVLKNCCLAFVDCEIVVIGIEPKTIEVNTDLSKEVRKKIGSAVKLVLAELSCQSC